MDGDLISRKALLEKLDECDKLVRKLAANVDDKDEMIVTLSVVRKFVNNRPAVDAEPVRCGTWVQSRVIPSFHHCSYCKSAFEMKATCNTYALFNYCPNCGAKMGEEDTKDGKTD